MTDPTNPSLTDPNSNAPAGAGDNAGAGSGAPNQQPSGEPAARWFDALPENLKSDPNVTRYADLGKFAEAKLHLDKHFGVAPEDLIRKPKADDKDGWSKLYTALGRPEKPEAYELPAPPEGLADLPADIKTKAMAKFHELGLNNQQASALWALNQEVSSELTKSIEAVSAAELAAGHIDLKNHWGAQFDTRVALAQQYIAQTADPKLLEFLDSTGLNTHPGMFKLVGDLVAKLQPSGSMPGGGKDGDPRPNPGGLTPNEAQGQLEAFRADTEKTEALSDRSHPKHAIAKREYDALIKTISGG